MFARYVVTLFIFAELIQSQSPNIPLSQLVELPVYVGSSVQLQCNLSSIQSKHLIIWWHNDQTVYNGQDGSLDKRFSVLIKPNQQFLVIDEATENYIGQYRAETVDGGEVLIQYHLVLNAAGSPRPTASVLDDATTHQPFSTTQRQQPESSANLQSVTYGGYGDYYDHVLLTICAAILVYFFAEYMKKYRQRQHTAAMPHTEQETSQDKHQTSKPGTETSSPTPCSQAVDENYEFETDNDMNLHRAEQVALTGVIAER